MRQQLLFFIALPEQCHWLPFFRLSQSCINRLMLRCRLCIDIFKSLWAGNPNTKTLSAVNVSAHVIHQHCCAAVELLPNRLALTSAALQAADRRLPSCCGRATPT
jgi:hypothetical protein